MRGNRKSLSIVPGIAAIPKERDRESLSSVHHRQKLCSTGHTLVSEVPGFLVDLLGGKDGLGHNGRDELQILPAQLRHKQAQHAEPVLLGRARRRHLRAGERRAEVREVRLGEGRVGGVAGGPDSAENLLCGGVRV